MKDAGCKNYKETRDKRQRKIGGVEILFAKKA
jgi:hypothetical protein